MANKSKKQKAKQAAKTTGKVATAGYAWRLAITGGAAKRVAQKNALRSDAKRVGRTAGKAAVKAGNSKAGLKVSNTRAGVGAAMVGERTVRKTKKLAGSGPGEMAKNVKKSVTRKRNVRSNYYAGKLGVTAVGPSGPKTNTSKAYKAGAKVASSRRARRSAAANAVSHVGRNKKGYAAGAVGVAAAGGAAYAYKRRKAKKTAGSTVSNSTYKRRTKSGKVITVKKGRGANAGKRAGMATGRTLAYGSSRYTTKGASNPSRKKTAALNAVGGPLGRKVARKKGYAVRTKRRASVRAVKKGRK